MLLRKVNYYHTCTVGTLQLTNGVVCQIWSTCWCKNIILFIAVLHEPLCIKLMTMLAFHRIHWILLCFLSRRTPQKKIFWNLLKRFSCPIDKKKSKFHHWDSISFRFLKFSPQVLRHEKHCKMMDIFLWFSSSQSTYIINNNFVQNYPFSMYTDYF